MANKHGKLDALQELCIKSIIELINSLTSAVKAATPKHDRYIRKRSVRGLHRRGR